MTDKRIFFLAHDQARRGVAEFAKAAPEGWRVKNVQMAAAGRKDIETSEAVDLDGHVTRILDVGIDPGVRTGFAIWSSAERRLLDVATLGITEAMKRIETMAAIGSLRQVRFEDARLRTWFGSADARQSRSGAGIREGVGSVKRDCAIWAEFLGGLGLPYHCVKPTAGATKMDAETFAKLAKWTARTSNHGRDAALLVIGL